MNSAIKCPDCSTWWRGKEHRCAPAVKTKSDNNIKSKFGCSLCGATGVHHCLGPRRDEEEKRRVYIGVNPDTDWRDNRSYL